MWPFSSENRKRFRYLYDFRIIGPPFARISCLFSLFFLWYHNIHLPPAMNRGVRARLNPAGMALFMPVRALRKPSMCPHT